MKQVYPFILLLSLLSHSVSADEQADKIYKKRMAVAEYFDKTRVQPAAKENIKLEAQITIMKRAIDALPAKSPRLPLLQADMDKLVKALAVNKLFPDWLKAWKLHADGVYKGDSTLCSTGASQLRDIHVKYKELTDNPFPNPEAEVELAEMKLEDQKKRKMEQAEKNKTAK